MSMYDDLTGDDTNWDDNVGGCNYEGDQCPKCGQRDNYKWFDEGGYFTEAPTKHKRCNNCGKVWGSAY